MFGWNKKNRVGGRGKERVWIGGSRRVEGGSDSNVQSALEGGTNIFEKRLMAYKPKVGALIFTSGLGFGS